MFTHFPQFTGHLSEHIGSLCLSSEYSDVTLIVEGQRIPAHKVILAASSDYFRALLYGGMREANQVRPGSLFKQIIWIWFVLTFY